MDDTPKTLTDATRQKLRGDIISGKLKPGSKIHAQSLAKTYGVGNSPLREALFQLVSERFVSFAGQRGFSVADLTLTDLLDITEWRTKLECDALRRSMANRTVEWEAEFISELHKLNGIEADTSQGGAEAATRWETQHRRFHQSLYSRCGSDWLIRFCALLGEHGERYRRAFVEYREIDGSIREEHEALKLAILNREEDRAVALLHDHIQHAARLAENFLSSAEDPNNA